MQQPLKHLLDKAEKKFDEKFILEKDNRTYSGTRLICDPRFAKSFIHSLAIEVWNERGKADLEALPYPDGYEESDIYMNACKEAITSLNHDISDE